MPQKTSPFLEGKYGWNYGESGWNYGMDENLLKFSFMFDRNVDGVVDSLPSAVNGEAYFLTTDNRLYFAIGGAWYSSPTPKWSKFTIRDVGEVYQFNGTSVVKIDTPEEIDTRLNEIELTLNSLGSAAYEDADYFASTSDVISSLAASKTYTDALRTDLAVTDDITKGGNMVGFSSDLSGAVARNVQVKIKEIVSVGDFGAVGDGIIDDTAALVSAGLSGKTVTFPDGSYRITGPIYLSIGTTFVGGNGNAGTTTNASGEVIFEGGARIVVDFGAGITEVDPEYYTKSAITLDYAANLIGLSFYWPGQPVDVDDTVTPPIAFPPAISIAEYSYSNTISRVNLCNAYVGIDAMREHGELFINDLVGYPLFRGIRLGRLRLNDYVSRVDFGAHRILSSDSGGPWVSPNVASWPGLNGKAVELGRVSWTLLHSVFAFGYSEGIGTISQDYTSGPSPRSVETVHIHACGFDSCLYGIRVNNTPSWGLHITDTFFAPRYLYDPTNINTAAVYYNSNSPSDRDLKIHNCRVWSATASAFVIINSDGATLTDNEIRNYGSQATGAYGIYLQNCPGFIATNNRVRAGIYGTDPKGIYVNTGCDHGVLEGNVVQYTGSQPIRILSDYVSVRGNSTYNNKNTSLVAVSGITKGSGLYNCKIEGNLDNVLPEYTNSDVDANGILQLRAGERLVRYAGTATINGISSGDTGQFIVIRFAVACTVSDEFATASQANRLYLAGNMTGGFGRTLSLVCNGNTGWYETSRSSNS